jgi:hypothetical protein
MALRDLALRFVALSMVVGAVVAACGGSRFAAEEGGGAAGTGGTSGESGAPAAGGSLPGGGTGGSTAGTGGGTSGTGGTTGGGTKRCTQALDCDDRNPCTLDTCMSAGVCENTALCEGDQLCCDGLCSECCGALDCQDGKSCTDDVCFAGFCTNPPNAECLANEVCGETGCVPREECNGGAECDDGNPCTTDTCLGGFCDNATCPDGGVCCDGMGCAACCIDAQCASADSDPCTLNTCENGECHVQARCDPGELCCPSSDGQSATCGTCCTAMDCADDGVPCTTAVCGEDGCVNKVIPGYCAEDETCDPVDGCIGGAECLAPSDCTPPTDPCDTVACTDGSCVYGDVLCPNNQTCCSETSMEGVGNCRGCCTNDDCSDNAFGALCCPADGACHECCEDTDCGLVVTRISTPPVVGGGCTVPVCTQGLCATKALCGSNEVCCNGACLPAGSSCVDPEI